MSTSHDIVAASRAVADGNRSRPRPASLTSAALLWQPAIRRLLRAASC